MITLYVPALDEREANRMRDAIADDTIAVEWIDGNGAKSYSWLVNQAIRRAPHEFVLWANDRIHPTNGDIHQMVALLQDGFGFVGLYRVAFGGLWKEAVRKIGFMDEEYGNGAEDGDLLFRLGEADIAIYEAESAAYAGGTTRWWPRERPGTRESGALFYEKWGFRLQQHPPVVERLRQAGRL